jgi:hypothetical protein
MFAGEPQYIATDSAGHTRIVPVNGEPKEELDRDRIASLCTRPLVRTGGAAVMDQYDAYYLDRLRESPCR